MICQLLELKEKDHFVTWKPYLRTIYQQIYSLQESKQEKLTHWTMKTLNLYLADSAKSQKCRHKHKAKSLELNSKYRHYNKI